MKEKVEKSMSGRYKDNSENRRLHRVGQEYHHGSQQGSDSENERQIKALQSKIEQMQKNKHIFIEQGGEMRYNRALGVLQGKLNDLQSSRKAPAEKEGGSGSKNEVVHDINGVKVKVTKNSNGSYTLEANGKKFKTDDPSYFVFGTDIKPRVKAALAKEVGIESQKPTETSENNEERQKIANRVEKVFAKVAADENVEQTLLREYVKNKIKDSAFDTEILTSKVKDNLNKMIGHLNETKEGKEVLKELKKFKGSKQLSSEKELQAIDKIIDDVNSGKRVVSKEVMDGLLDKKSKLGTNTTKKEDTPKETFTRVKFDDVPNSGKVNLKKYLSDKRQKVVDERWGSISKITDADLKKMEQGLVNKFNESFESSSKAQRAEDLYHIMKVKGEIAKRSKKN